MIKAILTKIKSTHNNLRTNIINGYFFKYPNKGENFVFYSEPLNPDFNLRMISTSDVKNVNNIDNDILEFETFNSTYKLEIIK